MATTDEVLAALDQHLVHNGPIVISTSNDHFLAGSEWGQEAEDSPMAGAAAYGTGPTAIAALAELLADTTLR